MKSGLSNLTLRPPTPGGSAQEALDRISKADKWTQEPAREAAQAIETPAPEPTPQPAPKKARTAAPKPAQPHAPERAKMPWEEGDDKGVQSFNFKLPIRLAQKLKYLGDSTYGASMTSIVIDALEAKIDAMLKERNLT